MIFDLEFLLDIEMISLKGFSGFIGSAGSSSITFGRSS